MCYGVPFVPKLTFYTTPLSASIFVNKYYFQNNLPKYSILGAIFTNIVFFDAILIFILLTKIMSVLHSVNNCEIFRNIGDI